MVNIDARGYVNNPKVATTKTGKSYVTFGLGVKQKEKNPREGEPDVTWANYNVTQWGATEAPTEKSFVTLKGFMRVREYTKDGVKRQSLDITCQELEVSEPLNRAAATEKDPWDE